MGPDPYALRMARRVLGIVNTVFAVSASVLGSLYFFGADGYEPTTRTVHSNWWSILSLLAGIGAAVMLCWRHRWPTLVTAIAVVPSLVFVSDALAALISLAALAANRRDHVLWMGTAAVYAASTLTAWRDLRGSESIAGTFVTAETTAGQVVGAFVVAAIVTAIPLLVGIIRGVRGDLRRQQAHERELRAEMTRQEERSRIAREMHDVLGHRLSLLSLHAGALEVSSGEEPSRVEAARTVRTAARQSLEDLRQVIGVLRGGGEGTEGPRNGAARQPALNDLPNLVADSRKAGLVVDLTMLLEGADAAPPQLGTAAYRIVQEALTNVFRHAPGSPAAVSVRGGKESGLAIEVVNPLPAGPPAEPSPGSGTGLTGIGERVALLGGSVSAGPTDGGVFTLRVWLPWPRQ
ncbi:two-component sensor histidine kinase [Amycolatopsis taiwanensis]|uniref:histidine kinase n=2 Tax=Amycolatopsis taiwanensis TaxID=342230 RepID=A0A9W6QZ00_9PSEU|nr:two-component sensor histidine kinase [Amycolatopsis taiwanensis]